MKMTNAVRYYLDIYREQLMCEEQERRKQLQSGLEAVNKSVFKQRKGSRALGGRK